MNIVIAMPCYDEQVSAVTTESILYATQALCQAGHTLEFIKHSYYDVATSRNLLLSHWYFNYPQSSHLVFIDNDIGFTAQMLLDMLAEPADVVGTTFHMRKLYLAKFHRLARDGKGYNECKTEAMQWVGELLENTAPFATVAQMRGAVLCIDRIGITQLITRMNDVIQPLHEDNPFNLRQLLMAFSPVGNTPIPNSEIYSFCWRMRQTGGTLRMATSYPITHVGSYRYEGTRISCR